MLISLQGGLLYKLGLIELGPNLIKKQTSAGSGSSNNSDTNTIAPGSPKTPTAASLSLSAALAAASDLCNSAGPTTSSPSSSSSKAAEMRSDDADIAESGAIGGGGTLTAASFPADVRLKIARQFSDGYSSSCTPLSASSINNEHPSTNPFFTDSAASPKAE
jgi:hypothetical protein